MGRECLLIMQRSVVTVSDKGVRCSQTGVVEAGDAPAVLEERLGWTHFDRRVKYAQTTKGNRRFHATDTKAHCLPLDCI